MVSSDQLVLEGGDGLDAFLLESLEPGVEGLLLGEQGLDGRQVASVVVGPDLGLLIGWMKDLRDEDIFFLIHKSYQILQKILR